MRKMAHFRPFTAHFGGFEGFFSFRNTKSAILCPTKTEVADFVSFKGLIVQGINLQKILFYVEKCDIMNYSSEIVMKEIYGNGNNK